MERRGIVKMVDWTKRRELVDSIILTISFSKIR
jgi:hypothetical protein